MAVSLLVGVSLLHAGLCVGFKVVYSVIVKSRIVIYRITFCYFFYSFSTSVMLCKALLHKLHLSAAILIQLFTDFQLVSIYYIMIIVIVMNKDLVFLIL